MLLSIFYLYEMKIKLGFSFYFNFYVLGLIFRIKVLELDHLNVNSIWKAVLILMILTNYRPKLIVKKFRKTFFKVSFFVYIVLNLKGFLAVLYYFNINLFYELLMIMKKLIKGFFFFLLIGLSFIRFHDVKPEFFRWDYNIEIFWLYSLFNFNIYNNLINDVLKCRVIQ